jgi:DNA-binding transcriptional LysR family regulator
MPIRLEDIDYFLAVVRHGQVRRAAVELGVSQPALTKGVQRIERELGFELFERTTKGMKLTGVAEHFYERTRSVRDNFAAAIKESVDMHLGAMGVLRVGVSPLYVERVFIPACLQLHRQRPAARLVVNINLNDVLLTALRRGDIDLSINALPAAMPDDVQSVPLLTDDLCMVVRQGHPLLGKRRLRVTDLAEAQWLLPGSAVAVRRSIEAVYTRAGLPPPRVAVEVNTGMHLTPLLLRTDLIGVASESTLRSDIGEQLVVLPLAEGRFRRQIAVVTRRGPTLPPLAQRFIDVLFESLGESRDISGLSGV